MILSTRCSPTRGEAMIIGMGRRAVLARIDINAGLNEYANEVAEENELWRKLQEEMTQDYDLFIAEFEKETRDAVAALHLHCLDYEVQIEDLTVPAIRRIIDNDELDADSVQQVLIDWYRNPFEYPDNFLADAVIHLRGAHL